MHRKYVFAPKLPRHAILRQRLCPTAHHQKSSMVLDLHDQFGNLLWTGVHSSRQWTPKRHDLHPSRLYPAALRPEPPCFPRTGCHWDGRCIHRSWNLGSAVYCIPRVLRPRKYWKKLVHSHSAKYIHMGTRTILVGIYILSSRISD